MGYLLQMISEQAGSFYMGSSVQDFARMRQPGLTATDSIVKLKITQLVSRRDSAADTIDCVSRRIIGCKMSINAPSTSLLPRSAFYNGQLRHAQLSASARRPHYAKLHAVAALQDKGQRLAAGDIQVKSSIGEGSYGQVFEVSQHFFAVKVFPILMQIRMHGCKYSLHIEL